jgi:predicted phage tail protein
MAARLQTVKLAGQLGSKFGRVHRAALETNSITEAIRYLRSQRPGFAAYMAGAEGRGIRFAVFRGKENLRVEQLHEPVGNDVIRIVPVLMGAKRAGIGSIIAGVILLAIAYLVPVTAPYTAPAGYGLIAGGVIQMLTPLPKGGKAQDRPDNAPSYVFSGAVNTQAQGNPVPLLYGRMIVGSAVVSAGIHAEDYSPVNDGVGTGHPHWNPKNPYEVFA